MANIKVDQLNDFSNRGGHSLTGKVGFDLLGTSLSITDN